MWGDNEADLFTNNPTPYSGDVLVAPVTVKQIGPYAFAQAAYNQAVRDLMPTMHQANVVSRQYPLYLRTQRDPDRRVYLMVEDRTERRPLAMQDITGPFPNPVTVPQYAENMTVTTNLGLVDLDTP